MTWKTCLSSIAATALVACGGSSSGGGSSGGGTLVLTANPMAVIANGTNAAIVHVEGSTKGPVVVRTDRGRFLEAAPGGDGLTVQNPTTAPFDVTLVSCDSRVVLTGCAGNAQVSASDQNLASNRIQVRFVGVELCTNGIDDDGDGLVDCADPDCASQVCGANGKTCSASSPSSCACPSGQANETPAQCSAAVPLDNDCDGKAGCADSDCTGRSCATGTLGSSGFPLFGTCKLTAGVGSCTCVSTQGTKETSCGDGLDNDCDGLIDCDDPDCQPVGNGAGGVCDTLGHTCSPKAMTGGRSICGVVCSGNGGTPQLVETNCFDGKDNDCNGVADCQDPNCATYGLACKVAAADPMAGKTCSATTFTCVCNSPQASGELTCDDGVDNDCNGYIDCKDLGCKDKPCGPNGRSCSTTANGNGSCACPTGTVETCNDHVDNNCDGLADCADPTCRPATVSGVGKDCATGFPANGGAKCDFVGQCVCPGGQVAETSCSDTLDNDCDGLVDCADPDCFGRSCGANGRTCTATGPLGCTCPGGATETGAQCRDQIDNNCDGLVDCADPGCQGTPGAQCGPNAVQQCTLVTGSWVCKDTSTNYVLTVVAASSRLAANGTAQTNVIATLKDGSLVPINGAAIAFSTSFGTIGAAGNTLATGQATVVFTAPLTSTPAVVTADYTTPTLAHVTATTTITLPQLSQLNLVNQQYAVMGAVGSGFQESNELTFQLVDTNNQTYPAGLTVTFEHGRLGGSYIGASPAGCTATTCTAIGVTDAAGKVKVILHSGSIANVVSVIARAQAGGSGLLQAIAGNIAIVGAKATGAEFVLDCSPKNIPALTSQDCTNSNYAGADSKITCTVTLADRFKNKLGVATVVSFLTEAGTAGPPASTPAYDTTKAPGLQPNLGRTSDLVDAYGGKLPADVAPFTGEKSHTIALDACTAHVIRNPRDGLVTIIASVRGEEGFVDVNGNGVYDAGEPFIDQAEPFVDYNDNGLRESNEPFIDANNNGVWDGPNGVWDSDTAIWAQTRVLYTGYVFPPTFSGGEVGSRFFDAGLPPDPTNIASFTVSAALTGPPPVAATSDSVFLYFADGNYNLPNYKYTYAVSKAPSAAKAQVAFSLGGAPTTLDELGMSFTLQYCSVQVPTNPATQCGGSCTTSPCYQVVDVGGFSYGSFGGIVVTGGSAPDGDVCAYVTGTLKTTSTVNNQTTEVSTPIAVCGTSL